MTDKNQVEPVDNNPSRPSCRNKMKCNMQSVLKFISSLLLPMMLGIFTVVVTFQQQKSAQQQRKQDQLAAQQLRELERSLNDERYFNDILDRYIENMGILLKENHGLLQAMEFTSTLARAKTLNVIRQLDTQRIISVIRFLYETRQLSSRNGSTSIDLSTAELDHIDFRRIAVKKKILDGISLAGIHFYNVTLAGLDMKYINFASSNFDAVNFSETKLSHGDFSSTIWEYTNLAQARIRHTTFSSAVLTDSKCSLASFQHVDLSNTVFHRVNFSSAILFNINFNSSKLIDIDFSNALLKDVDFSSAELSNVKFTSAQFQNVIFSSAKLRQVDFSSSIPYNYYQYNLTFTESRLEMVNFTAVKFHKVNFDYSEQKDVNFSYAALTIATFNYAKIQYAAFHQASCIKAHFTWAILTEVDFTDANLKGALFIEARLNGTNFANANLQKSDLWTPQITDAQLRNAFSIQGARLYNKSQTLDRKLVKNGQSDYNILLASDWKTQTGSISVRWKNTTGNDYYFLLESYLSGAIMSQRIDLVQFKHPQFYANSKAILKGEMGPGVLVQLISIDDQGQSIAETNISFSVYISHLYLYNHVKELEIVVHFYPVIDVNGEKNNSWCRNLELFIDYGLDIIVPPRIEPMIPRNARWIQIGETLVEKWTTENQSDYLSNPHGISIADDQSIYIADMLNHRIIAKRDVGGKIETVAGGNGPGKGLHQLSYPTDVVFDSQNSNIIICDSDNKRIMQWSSRNNDANDTVKSGYLIIDNTDCIGLTMDDQRSLYVSDVSRHEIKFYLPGDSKGFIVAGGHHPDADLYQLHFPTYLFIHQENTLYVSDTDNNRVLKWMKEVKEGIIVAGGYGKGKSLNQLSGTAGIWVDRFHTVYVVDIANDRIMGWQKESREGAVIVERISASQSANPIGLFFDRHGHMYVTDRTSGVLKRFQLDID